MFIHANFSTKKFKSLIHKPELKTACETPHVDWSSGTGSDWSPKKFIVEEKNKKKILRTDA